MTSPLTHQQVGRTLHVRMDDGRRNVMSPHMLGALHDAFDAAAETRSVVVLSGRPDTFSAGFDLGVFAKGTAQDIHTMLRLGAELALKILSFPTPVITVTSGHAYPMGAFLMLSADWRIGTHGSWRVGLNEVQIGLTVPRFALEVARQRLAPAWFSRTAITGEMFAPDDARQAGFIDDLVSTDDLEGAVGKAIKRMEGLDPTAHAATKLRARGSSIAAIRAAIDAELTLENAEKTVARRMA
jgi:enoyl-CoA hydratase